MTEVCIAMAVLAVLADLTLFFAGRAAWRITSNRYGIGIVIPCAGRAAGARADIFPLSSGRD